MTYVKLLCHFGKTRREFKKKMTKIWKKKVLPLILFSWFEVAYIRLTYRILITLPCQPCLSFRTRGQKICHHDLEQHGCLSYCKAFIKRTGTRTHTYQTFILALRWTDSSACIRRIANYSLRSIEVWQWIAFVWFSMSVEYQANAG